MFYLLEKSVLSSLIISKLAIITKIMCNNISYSFLLLFLHAFRVLFISVLRSKNFDWKPYRSVEITYCDLLPNLKVCCIYDNFYLKIKVHI